jgi:hypothetical protein
MKYFLFGSIGAASTAISNEGKGYFFGSNVKSNFGTSITSLTDPGYGALNHGASENMAGPFAMLIGYLSNINISGAFENISSVFENLPGSGGKNKTRCRRVNKKRKSRKSRRYPR